MAKRADKVAGKVLKDLADLNPEDVQPAGKRGRKPKKEQPVIREWVSVRHDYTQEERLGIGDQLAKELQNAAELNEQLKSVSADYKAKLKGATARVNELTNKVASGYEVRQVEVRIEMNRKKGKKKLFHYCPGKPEHNKFIREEDMTQSDYQRLPMDTPAAKPEKTPKDKPEEAPAGAVTEPPTDDPEVQQSVTSDPEEQAAEPQTEEEPAA